VKHKWLGPSGTLFRGGGDGAIIIEKKCIVTKIWNPKSWVRTPGTITKRNLLDGFVDIYVQKRRKTRGGRKQERQSKKKGKGGGLILEFGKTLRGQKMDLANILQTTGLENNCQNCVGKERPPHKPNGRLKKNSTLGWGKKV